MLKARFFDKRIMDRFSYVESNIKCLDKVKHVWEGVDVELCKPVSDRVSGTVDVQIEVARDRGKSMIFFIWSDFCYSLRNH